MINRSLLALLALLAALPLWAAGLGPIQVRSHLHEPLDAAIPVLAEPGEDLGGYRAQLAPDEAFERVGLTPSALLRQIGFSLERDAEGNGFVHLTSNRPLHEPLIELVLDLRWAEGHLRREYSLLLDLPPTGEEPVETPPSAVEPAIAEAPPAPVAVPAAALAVAQADPREPPPSPASPPAGRGEEPAVPADAPLFYGPVRTGETLGHVAQNLTRPGGAMLEQVMVALWRANPTAFAQGRMYALKGGVTLKIPPMAVIAAIDADEAVATVQQQRPRPRAQKRSSAKGGEAARLRIVKPTGAVGEGELRAQLERVRALKAQLETERSDLWRRLGDVEAQVTVMTEQVLAMSSPPPPAAQEGERLGDVSAFVPLQEPPVVVPVAAPVVVPALPAAPVPWWREPTAWMASFALLALLALLVLFYQRRQSRDGYGELMRALE